MRYAVGMPEPAPTAAWCSECAIRVEVGSAVSEGARAGVYAAHRALLRPGLPGLLDITPAYTTVLLTFDPLRVEDPDAVLAAVRGRLGGLAAVTPPPTRTVEIQVCYDAEFGPDLADVASMHSMSPAGVVALHAGAEYRVEFLGFSPGFPYLSGLPEGLATPRLETPRARIPAGSVAIGGGQAGIYPQATPGGWRIIGRTPRRLFDAGRAEPSLLRAGDGVRFVPISRERFEELVERTA